MTTNTAEAPDEIQGLRVELTPVIGDGGEQPAIRITDVHSSTVLYERAQVNRLLAERTLRQIRIALRNCKTHHEAWKYALWLDGRR